MRTSIGGWRGLCSLDSVKTIRWLALLLVGCGGGATTHPPTTPNTTTDTTNEAAVADLADCQPHAYGGVTQFVAMSLDAVALTPEQRGRFVPITADLYTKMEVVRSKGTGVARQTFANWPSFT